MDGEEAEHILESESGVPEQFEGEFNIIDTQSGQSIETPYQIVQGLDGQLFVITGLEPHLVSGETETGELHHEMEDDLNVEFDNEIQGVVEIPNEMEIEREVVVDGDGEAVDTYDATIDSVIRTAAKTVTDEEVEAAFRARCKKRRLLAMQKKTCTESHVSKDSLPFQYSGQSFDIQSQKLILNVLHFLREYKNKPKAFLQSNKTPQEKAARVLNISSSVIGKITKNLGMGMLMQPGKTRKAPKRILDSVKPEHEEVIRLIYREMLENNQSPCIPPILLEARKRINYQGSRTSFRRILSRMGFKFMRVDNRVVMIDTTDPSRSAPASATKLKGPGQGRKKENWCKKPPSMSQIPDVHSTEEPSESELNHSIPNYDEGMTETTQSSAEFGEASENLSDTDPHRLMFQVEGRQYCLQLELMPDQHEHDT